MDFVLCSLLFSATIIIGCIKYKRNAFADAIQIDLSNERSTSLQSDDPVADDSSENESVPSSRVSWRQGNVFDYTHEYEYLGPEHKIADVLKEPIDYFRSFFTDEFLDVLVCQSNLYSAQINPNKLLNVNIKEMEQWLGVSVYFSISKLPNTRMHWSKQLGSYREVVADVMSRNRWEEIKSKFHMVDNTTLDLNTPDKLFKIRPMVDYLREKFRKIPMTQSLCVDEQIVPFKGHSGIKQYMPNKPHKWGYKFFVLADSKGMTHDFLPYTGKIEPVNNENIPDLKASANSVLHLAQSIPNNHNHFLYFDNWFTSIPLMRHLATRGIWCCGTVRVNRIPGRKKGKAHDKDLMKKGRGAYEEIRSTGDPIEVTYVKWCDNKIVNIISTFAKSRPLTTVSPFDYKQRKKIDVECPNIIKLYNKSMGGVDLADCLIELYRINIRSKKYYFRLIFHMIDMVIVNSWLLYKRDAISLKLPKSEILALAPFKLKVANCLMKENKAFVGAKRGRPSPPMKDAISKRRRPYQTLPDQAIRFDNVGHWPEIKDSRKMCKNPGCSGKTNVYCSKCDISLCLNSSNNCFKNFHTK